MNKKIILGGVGVLIIGVVLGMFLVVHPIVVVRFREQSEQLKVTFYKSPLLENNKIQIIFDPFRPYSVQKRSFLIYEVVVEKKYLKKADYTLRFVNGASGRVYTIYKIPFVLSQPEYSAQEATQAAQRIKDLAKEQYPYFDLFPYTSKNMKVAYEKPLLLTIYLSDFSSEGQRQALIEIDQYLKNFEVSIQVLKEKGVQTKFSVWTDKESQVWFSE